MVPVRGGVGQGPVRLGCARLARVAAMPMGGRDRGRCRTAAGAAKMPIRVVTTDLGDWVQRAGAGPNPAGLR